MANAIDLPGCTPEPLMGYLKALGLFRLVATQADPAARLSWANGDAVLHTTLDRDGLLDFFLNRYCPTPVLAPWNGGGGFQGSESGPVDEIIAATSPRLALYQQTIKLLKDSPIATLSKDRVMAWCRNELPDEVVVWLDACFVLTEKGFRCFPLLGTAGNDGRLDFTKNFMERLGDVISYAQGAAAPADSKSLLLAGLFANTLTKLKKSSIGQFNPGNVGGANARQGNFEADSRVNPWDFVLSVE